MAGEGCPAAGKKVMKSLLKCDFTQMQKDAKCDVFPWKNSLESEKLLFPVGEVEDSTDVAAAVQLFACIANYVSQ